MKVSPGNFEKMENRHKEYISKVTKLTNKNYLTRTSIMEQIPVPNNSSSLIIIPSNEKGSGFLRNGYDYFYCSSFIQKFEFDQTVDALNLQMAKLFSKKRKIDEAEIPKYQCVMLGISAITLLLFLIMVFYVPKYGTLYSIATFTACVVSILLIIIISILNVLDIGHEDISFDDMVQKEIPIYLDNINNSKFRKRGFEWYIMPGHYWLELRITSRATPGHIPNLNTLNTGPAEQLQTEIPLREEFHEETKERFMESMNKSRENIGDLTKILEDMSIDKDLHAKS
ncbi:unnamed protein product [Moneuplotes crassus]|uniref:Uncharacterized protein n=1 Tax=Euplotes crassus TaxID=5936 RepID=A0AAD1UE61_EUPCR|nr:unnamed protein product [Moneuplotes crassus]